jgi:mannitol/fructose-specific phosphotransferase system IIA component (Ntr-type)/CBS domain-containing protein
MEGERLAIVVGYGPVGRSVHRALKDAGIRTVIIDFNVDTVSALKAEGQAAIFGDASNESILEEAGVKQASHLVITLPDASQRSAIVTASRNLSATLRIVVRARYLRERDELEQSGASAAVFEEAEAAVALSRLVLADAGLHRQATEGKLKDIRLQLIMDNMSNLSSQRVATVMVPWARVRWLSSEIDQPAVLTQIARERFSRWPVVDPHTRRPTGYLLAKDLIADSVTDGWSDLVRPLKSVHPDDSIEATLARMQEEGDSIYLVEDSSGINGLITLEDILEQVFGRLEDEHPHEAPVSLVDAVAHGGIIKRLAATSRDEAIRELVAAVPSERLPGDISREQLVALTLAREEKISTDLGNGIAIPHARCPGLASPLVVVGKSRDGVEYSTAGNERVRLFFLLVTPAEKPESQLALLSQLARIAGTESVRDALFGARSAAELLEILRQSSRARVARKTIEESGGR